MILLHQSNPLLKGLQLCISLVLLCEAMPGVGDNARLLFVPAEVELWDVVPLQALSKKKLNNRMHSDAF
jgi:hypothetical protein